MMPLMSRTCCVGGSSEERILIQVAVILVPCFLTVGVLAVTVSFAVARGLIILGLLAMPSWWNFLPLEHWRPVRLAQRWPTRGVELLVSTGIMGVASPRVAVVGNPAGCIGVIAVDTITRFVSETGGVIVDPVVGAVMVLVMAVVVVIALLSWIVRHRDFLGKL